MRESIGSVRAATLSPVRRTGAARFRQTRVFNFKKQRAPFRNFFPRIEVGVATRNLGFMALTVSEILAFEVLVQFLSLSNKLLKHSKRQLTNLNLWIIRFARTAKVPTLLITKSLRLLLQRWWVCTLDWVKNHFLTFFPSPFLSKD